MGGIDRFLLFGSDSGQAFIENRNQFRLVLANRKSQWKLVPGDPGNLQVRQAIEADNAAGDGEILNGRIRAGVGDQLERLLRIVRFNGLTNLKISEIGRASCRERVY